MTKSTKYYSSKQEKTISDELNWNLVAASGSRPCSPGDIKNEYWVGECKTHTKPNSPIRFLYSVWKKICEEADSTFHYPVLFVDDGTQCLNNTWCLVRSKQMPEDVYKYPGSYVIYSYPYAIRENISFSHDRLMSYVKNKKLFDIYYFNLTWHGENVSLLPFSLFSHLFGN